MVLKKESKGLFQLWLEIELATGKPLKQILDEINRACGTAYKHNWPAKMAGSNFTLERTPVAVRRYMMRRVLPFELAAHGVVFTSEEIEVIIRSLT